jgi:general secretion pathway protein A
MLGAMYKKFFGLKHEPFSIAPDPHYLFMSERHREALAHLLYGVRGGGGFVLLTGEIGAGKTTVCRCFLEQVPRRCNVAYIFNPRQTAEELLESICADFRILRESEPGRVPSARDHVAALNEFLLRTHGVGQNNVLIIDEAQSLSAEVLEQLRLLTNLETNERKLLQIILIGQPELRDMLARPELEQLAQRVIARYHLGALTAGETEQYIHHRLTVSGLSGALPFDAASMQRIHALSRGVPRRINLLCDRALLGAYARGRARVDVAIVDKAAAEVQGEMSARERGLGLRSPRARVAAALGLGIIAGAALFGAGMLAFDAMRAASSGAPAAQRQAGG